MEAKDKQGRVDVLFSELLAAQVARSGNPLLQTLFTQVQPDVDRILKARFGPRSEASKRAKRLVRQLAGQPAEPKRKRKVKTGVRSARVVA